LVRVADHGDVERLRRRAVHADRLQGARAEVLATFPLFAGVSKRSPRKLVQKTTFAEFAAGETVLSRGRSTDSLYVILGGAAKTLEHRVEQNRRSDASELDLVWTSE
jgi:signal-transduction protein with cAMP-binding, CBS, and nucleotidyltransferase domain